MSVRPRTFCAFGENLKVAAMMMCLLPTCDLGFGSQIGWSSVLFQRGLVLV